MIFGFIGTGNMGGALAKAAAKSLAPEELLLSDKFAATAQALASTLGCQAKSVEEVAQEAELLFLGVDPQALCTRLNGMEGGRRA